MRYGAAVGVVIQRTIWGAAGAGRWAEYCYSRHILNLRFVGVGCYRAHISPLVLAELFCLHFRSGQPTAHISPVGKVGTFLLGHGYPVSPVRVLLSAAQFWFGLRLRGLLVLPGFFRAGLLFTAQFGVVWNADSPAKWVVIGGTVSMARPLLQICGILRVGLLFSAHFPVLSTSTINVITCFIQH